MMFKDEWLIEPIIEAKYATSEIIKNLSLDNSDTQYLSDKLISLGYISEEDIGKIFEKTFHIPYVNLSQVPIDSNSIGMIPEEICRKHVLFPYKTDEQTITIAIHDPLNFDAENEVAYIARRIVKTRISSRTQIEYEINKYYNSNRKIDDLTEGFSVSENESENGERKTNKFDITREDAPIVKLTSSVINDAIDKGSSDIHIEPTDKKLIIRYRIDGILRKIMEIPKYAAPQLISRIKVISNLDIAETRKPQDGQAKVHRGDASVDLRISILPMSYGEKVVIRILDGSKGSIPLDKLGITGDNLKKLNRVLDLKQGIVLAAGPTGSGKTTTLYAALNKIKSPEMNILTIEDPIEYTVDGINQVQVNVKAGITFASALRTFLRQDPDVILVGEIRDPETAEISIQAALTGHLVLSTIHTNSAVETITRLIDIGVDRYKVTSALSAVIGQRLIRKLCPSCCEEVFLKNAGKQLLHIIKTYNLPQKLYKSKGCTRCDFTGYKGRIGIYEILILDNEIKSKIEQGSSSLEIENLAIKKGFKKFSNTAIELVTSGITDFSEINRVLTLDFELPEIEDEKITTKISKESASGKIHKDENSGLDIQSQIPDQLKKILVVDDNRIMRKLVGTLLLKEKKYEIVEAEDGIEALEKIQRDNFDLIILDVMMPRLDGYGVCQKLRESKDHADLPILMLTSLDAKDDMLKAFNAGVDDFIAKPVDNTVLSAKVASLLKRRESL